MSATLISLSPDLAKLEAEGFRLRIVPGDAHHLLIDSIPAVTKDGRVVAGTLYSPLLLDAEGRAVNPVQNHQCWWIGEEPPCDAQGRVMDELISHSGIEPKGDGIETQFAFSRIQIDKRPYSDYHEKIWTYVRLIWHEAREVDPSSDPRSDKPVPAVVEAQKRAFHYPDMATTRAGIGAATARLVSDRIGIIGIGGTGSYILDLVAKTPVAEIHMFDDDTFELHNAFRAPGAPRKEELVDPLKVDWFGDIYDRMHRGLARHPYKVTSANLAELAGFNFVFVAVDDGAARKIILEGLIGLKVPFIDVGLDLRIDADGALRGITRFTLGTEAQHRHVEEVVSFAKADPDDLYRNIQVADLNMLNAAMAVGKWKKTRAFYADGVREHHSLYTVATHGLTKEDRA